MTDFMDIEMIYKSVGRRAGWYATIVDLPDHDIKGSAHYWDGEAWLCKDAATLATAEHLFPDDHRGTVYEQCVDLEPPKVVQISTHRFVSFEAAMGFAFCGRTPAHTDFWLSIQDTATVTIPIDPSVDLYAMFGLSRTHRRRDRAI